MNAGRIRPIAIGLVRRGDDILVSEGRDPASGEVFYRPLGGGIEFGEYGHQALIREMREELGAELAAVRYLATLENIFTYAGRSGHEIVQVYEAEFLDPSLYERDVMTGMEDDNTPMRVMWKPKADFVDGEVTLYPDGFVALVSEP